MKNIKKIRKELIGIEINNFRDFPVEWRDINKIRKTISQLHHFGFVFKSFKIESNNTQTYLRVFKIKDGYLAQDLLDEEAN